MKAVLLFLTAVQLVIQVNSHLNEYVKHFEALEYDRDGLMNRHHRLRRSNEEKSLELSFSAFNRAFNLVLQPDSASHTSYELLVDGKPHPKGLSDSFYYTGYDQQDGSYVHGSLAYGVFDGTIHGNDEIYYIEPSDRYYTNVSHHSVIYRQSDTIQYTTTTANEDSPSTSTPSFCGVGKDSNGRPTVKRSTNTQHQMNTRQDMSDGGPDKTKTKCELNIVADRYFYNEVTDDSLSESHRIAQATAIIKSIVLAGSNNFERTDFDGDSSPDNISFSIRSIEILTEDSQTNLRITDEFIGVEALLNAFSKDDYDDYCLSYLFTYREFENGVLGLAFIAEDGSSSAGLCAEKRSTSDRTLTYNTGLVTLRNYNRRVPQLVAEVTFTHEAGHNFGAQHDSERCVGEDNNNYVMFPQASDGTKSNNNRFSECSIEQMAPILQDRGQKMNGCFKHFDDNCGNLLIEPEEDCDCGNDFDKTSGVCFNDGCCNGTTCTIINNAECSPQQGPCCNDKCQIIPLFDDVICSDETECAYNQTCNGSSPYCPEADPIEPGMNQNGVPCNNGNNYCKNGECTGSICVPLQLEDCECSKEEYLCHVCCRLDGTCTSTFKIAKEDPIARSLLPNGDGTVIGVGYPCNMSQGYCDFFNTCRLVNSDGPIKRLTSLLRGTRVGRFAVNSIGRNWWVLIAVAAGIAIFAFVFVLVNHFYSIHSKRAKRKLSKKKKNSVKPMKVSVRPKPTRARTVPTLESYL